jgi:hypothetical protein
LADRGGQQSSNCWEVEFLDDELGYKVQSSARIDQSFTGNIFVVEADPGW